MFGTDILAPTHILLILVVALIVLGPKRLPEVGRSLGRGLRDFRSGLHGAQEEARSVFLDEPSQPPEDSAVSTVPEPIVPATVDTALAPTVTSLPAAGAITKVAPVEPDPAEYAD